MKNGIHLPPHMPPGEAPSGAVAADQAKLDHINTCGDLPEFYLDYSFSCRDCAKKEVWTAARQKWYYEEAKGHIWAVAVRCRDCRKQRRGNQGEAEQTG
jgi:hypothetical protein